MVGVLEVNKLIVESQNDKYFVQRIIKKLNLKNIEISEPICSIDEYICLDGISKLKNKLQDMKLDSIDKLGIIIDADDIGIEKRIDEINTILNELKLDIKLENINEFKKDSKYDLEIACYILNINGKGDLDLILKNIAINSTVYADCLSSWEDCLKIHKMKISEKEMIKFWVNNYIKFDICDKKERKQSFKNCNLEKALQKDVWNFEDKHLEGLKTFLKLF